MHIIEFVFLFKHFLEILFKKLTKDSKHSNNINEREINKGVFDYFKVFKSNKIFTCSNIQCMVNSFLPVIVLT